MQAIVHQIFSTKGTFEFASRHLIKGELFGSSEQDCHLIESGEDFQALGGILLHAQFLELLPNENILLLGFQGIFELLRQVVVVGPKQGICGTQVFDLPYQGTYLLTHVTYDNLVVVEDLLKSRELDFVALGMTPSFFQVGFAALKQRLRAVEADLVGPELGLERRHCLDGSTGALDVLGLAVAAPGTVAQEGHIESGTQEEGDDEEGEPKTVIGLFRLIEVHDL